MEGRLKCKEGYESLKVNGCKDIGNKLFGIMLALRFLHGECFYARHESRKKRCFLCVTAPVIG